MDEISQDEEAQTLEKLKTEAEQAIREAEKMPAGLTRDRAMRAAVMKRDEYRLKHSLWVGEEEDE